MNVQLIADRILAANHFISATSSAGPYWDQPDPGSGNSGDFRLLSRGDPEDFTYNGTTTSVGAGGGTTTICSDLAMFGDDFFIGATLAITSGVNSGESKTITDFAQSTGTLTHGAFSNQVASGITFTLTISFADRDIQVELTQSGDAGEAYFKWSHDGGSTWLGRDAPSQANWLAEAEIHGTVKTSTAHPIKQMNNGNILVVFNDSSDNKLYSTVSMDKGLSWETAVLISNSNLDPSCIVVLPSGRVLAFAGAYFFYTDDYGSTWAGPVATTLTFTDVVRLFTGNLLGVYESSGNIYCRVSSDNGASWSTAITISSASNTQQQACLVQLANGNIFCAYATDEDTATEYEIEGKLSSDGGATWGSAVDVINYSASGYYRPRMIRDINGDIYLACYFVEATLDEKIVFVWSTDNCATWTGVTDLKASGGVDLRMPSLALIDGHEVLCAYVDHTNGDLDVVRRGIWEMWGSACPVAPFAEAQALVCGAEIVWHGGAGIDDDSWSFAAEHYFASSNLIEDSPSLPWRSTADGSDCSLVLDMGSAEKLLASGLGLFGVNIEYLIVQMAVTNSWGAPSLSREVHFNIGTRNSNLGPTSCCTDPENDADSTTGWSTSQGAVSSVSGGVQGYQLKYDGDTDTGSCKTSPMSLTTGNHVRVRIFISTSVSNSYAIWLYSAAYGGYARCSNDAFQYDDWIVGQGDSVRDFIDVSLYIPSTQTDWQLHVQTLDKDYDVYVDNLTIELCQGELDSDISGNIIEDSSFLGNYKDHELAGFFLKFLSGGQAYKVYQILDNAGNYLMLEDYASSAGGPNLVDNSTFSSITKESKKGVVSITKANPGVVTFSSGHNYSEGDPIVFSELSEMVELNGKCCIISNQSGDSFDLSVDTSGYGSAETTGGDCAERAFPTDWAESGEIDCWGPSFNVDKAEASGLQSAVAYIRQAITPSAQGMAYTVTVTVSSLAAGNMVVYFGGATSFGTISSDGTHSFAGTRGSDAYLAIGANSGVSGYIDNVQVHAHDPITGDVFEIFNSSAAKDFTTSQYRYARLYIPAQETADNYYQIGSAVLGVITALAQHWRVGYSKDVKYGVKHLSTPAGGVIPIETATQERRTFELFWPMAEEAREELLALRRYIKGGNIVLIPDGSDLSEAYLVKAEGDTRQDHRFLDQFDMAIKLIEVR